MKDRASANRYGGRELADDKGVAVQTEYGCIQAELSVSRIPRLENILTHKRYTGQHFESSLMEPNLNQVLQRFGGGEE